MFAIGGSIISILVKIWFKLAELDTLLGGLGWLDQVRIRLT